MSEVNYLDDRKCINCINAKYKERISTGSDMFFCGIHHTYIFENTLVCIISGCRGKDYTSRVEEKRKPEPKKKPRDGQMTIDEWLQEVKA